MRSLSSLAGSVVGLLIAGGSVFAQETIVPAAANSTPPPACYTPYTPPGCLPPGSSGMPNLDPRTGQPVPGQLAPGVSDAFASQSAAGTGGASSFNPNMLGDASGSSSHCDRIVAIQNGSTRIPASVGTQFTPVSGAFYVLASGATIPVNSSIIGLPSTVTTTTIGTCVRDLPINTARGAFKITENESPAPQDRVFGAFNYFDNVNGSSNAGSGLPQTNIYRETIGFEKTFFDGGASIGMRLPFVSVTGDGSINRDDIGDLSIVAKYAFINDRDTGNVLSGGLVLTLPTGNSFVPNDMPDIHSVELQPYIGYIYHVSPEFFVQGFSAIAVPTDSRDVTYLFNDIGIGYNVWQSGDREALLSSVTPIFEAHLTTPLNHRGSDVDPIGGTDVLDLTTGVTFGFRHGSSMNVGVVTPVTGPKPFDVEAIVQFNLKF